LKTDGLTLTDQRLVLVAALFVQPGREADFHKYESIAANVMQRYGGRIERVVRTGDTAKGDGQPYEVHIITFPGQRELDDYRADPELARQLPLRQASILRTEIVIGVDAEVY
jgi:uncharacterized protein (DUF1330 family)